LDLLEATASSSSEQWRSGQLPRPIEQDREILAWLQCSPELGGEVTGYICDALLDWCLQGRPYPQAPAPAAGPAGDHLQLLQDVIGRLRREASVLPGVASKLELGRAVRLLNRAVQAVDDPDGVRDAIDRELVMMPSLNGQRLLPPGGLEDKTAAGHAGLVDPWWQP
jgi:hypothetical protein